MPGAQAAGVELFVFRTQVWKRIENSVTLATNGPDARLPGQQFKQQIAARTWCRNNDRGLTEQGFYRVARQVVRRSKRRIEQTGRRAHLQVLLNFPDNSCTAPERYQCRGRPADCMPFAGDFFRHNSTSHRAAHSP
jgi:hypothetical protein